MAERSARTVKGRSSGEWVAKSGSQSNKFQEEYYDLVEHGRDWLEDKGHNGLSGQYQSYCKLCKGLFNTRRATIISHAKGKGHVDEIQKMLAVRAARGGFAQAFLQGEAMRLERLERQSCSPQLVTLFTAVLKALLMGRPLSDLAMEQEYLSQLRTPDVPTSHWSSEAVWGIVEAIDHIIVQMDRELLNASSFYSASMDEATALGNMGFLCCHLYVLRDWRRIPVFMELAEVCVQRLSVDCLLLLSF